MSAMARRARGRRSFWWEDLPLRDLLQIPVGDLGLRIEGSRLEPLLARLRAELERAGLRFRPRAWLSTDWFCPEGSTAFAIPFWLAHPRLLRLEWRFLLRAEGGTAAECMRLLRHEAAHALDHACGLHRARSWSRTFGPYSSPYRASYTCVPASRRFVRNLGHWYAQSHPAEDFAETFAVWLAPGSRWRRRYLGWPALRKLEYVETVVPPACRRRLPARRLQVEDPVRACRMTLAAFYRRRVAVALDPGDSRYDRALRRVFVRGRPACGRTPGAGAFLAARRRRLRARIVLRRGHDPYVVDQALDGLIHRCRFLGLPWTCTRAAAEREAAELVADAVGWLMNGARPRFCR